MAWAWVALICLVLWVVIAIYADRLRFEDWRLVSIPASLPHGYAVERATTRQQSTVDSPAAVRYTGRMSASYTFSIHRDPDAPADEQWTWQVHEVNGQRVARSEEGFSRKAECIRNAIRTREALLSADLESLTEPS